MVLFVPVFSMTIALQRFEDTAVLRNLGNLYL